MTARVRPEFVVLLLLACTTSIFSSLYFDSRVDPADEPGSLIAGLGTGLRRSLSRYFYIRADQYIHSDPTGTRILKEDGQLVRQSTFKLSKESIPPLKLSILLDPHFVEATALLGSHIAVDMKQGLEGVRLLQRSIVVNEDHPKLFWLYGSIGRVYYESAQWKPAARYLEKAVQSYSLAEDPARLERFETRLEIQDQNYARSNLSMWLGAAFRAKDFASADRALAQIPDLNFIDSPIAQFLESWRSDPSLAEGFDPIAYINSTSHGATGAASSLPHQPITKEPEEVKAQVLVDIELESSFKMKLLALTLLPFLSLGSLWLPRRRR